MECKCSSFDRTGGSYCVDCKKKLKWEWVPTVKTLSEELTTIQKQVALGTVIENRKIEFHSPESIGA